MKNRRFERNRRLAKQYSQNKHSDQFEEGILIRYDYSGRDPNELSWWDDVMFIQCSEQIKIQYFCPVRPVKTFDKGILCRFSW
ncbi:hypothetical protein SAMN05421680_1607, partial [Xenorhabdus mauleonii]